MLTTVLALLACSDSIVDAFSTTTQSGRLLSRPAFTRLHESVIETPFKSKEYQQVKDRVELMPPSEVLPQKERESEIELDQLPQHIAIILDGNRRYGKEKYGDGKRGHIDGSLKLTEFAKWCAEEKIKAMTVYIFSTENWKRAQPEVDALMKLFTNYFQDLRPEAIDNNIRVRFLSVDPTPIPPEVKASIDSCAEGTKHCDGLDLNICLSYGSRGEIVNICRDIAKDVAEGKMDVDDISEDAFGQRMLTAHSPEPDVLIRTSGEVRLSNFLLWQLAYAEFFFVDKHWPELQKEDLLDVIRTFANGRKRRYGK